MHLTAAPGLGNVERTVKINQCIFMLNLPCNLNVPCLNQLTSSLQVTEQFTWKANMANQSGVHNCWSRSPYSNWLSVTMWHSVCTRPCTLRTPWLNCYRTATALDLIWLRCNVTGGGAFQTDTNLTNHRCCTKRHLVTIRREQHILAQWLRQNFCQDHGVRSVKTLQQEGHQTSQQPSDMLSDDIIIYKLTFQQSYIPKWLASGV